MDFDIETLSKGHIISDEENQFHVSQLCVCPFEGASHQMRVSTQSAGKHIWYRNPLSSFQSDLSNFVCPNCPGDKLSSKITKAEETHSLYKLRISPGPKGRGLGI